MRIVYVVNAAVGGCVALHSTVAGVVQCGAVMKCVATMLQCDVNVLLHSQLAKVRGNVVQCC